MRFWIPVRITKWKVDSSGFKFEMGHSQIQIIGHKQ